VLDLRSLTLRPATDGPTGPGSRALGWGSLRHLVVARMLVASLALPSGLLLRPDVTDRPVTLRWRWFRWRGFSAAGSGAGCWCRWRRSSAWTWRW
jgi:hypothetical protein